MKLTSNGVRGKPYHLRGRAPGDGAGRGGAAVEGVLDRGHVRAPR